MGPNAAWEDVIQRAFGESIDLTVRVSCTAAPACLRVPFPHCRRCHPTMVRPTFALTPRLLDTSPFAPNNVLQGWSAPNGQGLFTYQSYGMVATEVEIDVLTGEVQVLRADILLDCGESLNPAVDIGQAEGGFIMGLGGILTEEVRVGLVGLRALQVASHLFSGKVLNAHFDLAVRAPRFFTTARLAGSRRTAPGSTSPCR